MENVRVFDRIVINGYLSFFTREINVAWFFRHICQKPKVTKEVLTERTGAYEAWVAASARNHRLPLERAQKLLRRKIAFAKDDSSCELGLCLLTADCAACLLGRTRRQRIAGKWQNVLQRLEHGQHVFRTYFKNSFLKQYQKASTFLRLELVCNNLKDFGLKKTLPHWQPVRQRFQDITDRFAHTQAQHLNVHGQLDVLAVLAKPVLQGKTKVAGIKLENTRLMRLLETLLRGAGGHFRRWTTAQLHQQILDGYLSPRDDIHGVGTGGRASSPEQQVAYNEIYRLQLTEILTQYGPMSVLWER